jgi:hypothetical protein
MQRAHINKYIYIYIYIHTHKHMQMQLNTLSSAGKITDERKFILNVFESILQKYQLGIIDKIRQTHMQKHLKIIFLFSFLGKCIKCFLCIYKY